MKGHEVALLILITENQLSSEDNSSVYGLKNEMNKSGYTDIATSVGLRSLVKNGMVETFRTYDDYNPEESYIVCKLTEKGENWILSNQDQLQFRKIDPKSEPLDDLPF